MAPAEPWQPYGGFQGTVARELSRSRPWWPPRPKPPAGAPNVVIILADDLGYSDIGCYGSEIPTPHLDALAEQGLRYSAFHVAPSCSPTRAALLTGLNPHAAGFGFPAQFDPGFPGYAMELGEDVVTVAEAFRAGGYATMAVGKWHLAREADGGPGGSKASWPLGRGFDRYYGFLDGFTDYFAPHQLVEDNHVLDVERFPDGYYLTDDLTDAAIAMLRAQTAGRPDRPFFLYLAHGAVHAPLQAPAELVARHAEVYDMGWDETRARRFARQVDLGLVREGTRLPGRNAEPGNDVPAWADLDPARQRLYARYMAVYAAIVQSLDDSVGRLLAELDALGVADNTVVLFLSDNGASREGGPEGTSDYLAGLHGGFASHLEADLERFGQIGGPRTQSHYPRGWAMVSNTPFRLYKICTHAGAHQVPLVVSWPGRLAGPGGIRRGYHYVTDILPTLLDLAGLPRPTERDGRPARPLAGTSFAASLNGAAEDPGHGAQHYESFGNRGYYRDGREIVALHQPGAAFDDDEWELYDLEADPTQTDNLAAARPEVVRELAAEWERAASASQVFPLMDDFVVFDGLRPASDAAFERPVRIRPGTPTLDRYRSAKLVQHRSFRIDADVDLRADDEGVLVSHGGQGGGYLLFVEDRQLVFAHRAGDHDHELRSGPLPAGTTTLGASITAAPGARWSVELLVDGDPVARMDDLQGFTGMAPLQGIDVGVSRGSPVSWSLAERHGSYRWTGVLHAVAYLPGSLAADAPSVLADQRLRQRWD